MNAQELNAIWNGYTQLQGHAPRFARCMIQWKDDESLSNVTIALFEYDVDTEDDDRIFFYAGNKENFLRLADYNNEEDFYITELYGFTYTINF